MPEDLAPGFDFLSEVINSLPDTQGPPIMPTMPQGSNPLGELLQGLFENPGHGGPGDLPTDAPGPSFDDLVAQFFDSFNRSESGEAPAEPTNPTLEDVISELLNTNQGNFRLAQEAVPEAPPAEWEGNVPPDLTDGFDFLL